MPVHLTGRVAKMDEIQKIADRNQIFVIEDAAQAVGGEYKGKKAGSFGLAAGFSLHPLKNLYVYGDGGVISTNDKDLYTRLLKMRNHGLRNRDECEFWGYNSRLDALQAGVANIKLKYIDQWNEHFRKIASHYRDELQNLVSVPEVMSYEKPVYHRYVIRTKNRDELQAFLEEKGVESKINYPIPIHLQEAAKDLNYSQGSFPKTEQFSKEILSIPIYAELEDQEVEYVVAMIKDFFN